MDDPGHILSHNVVMLALSHCAGQALAGNRSDAPLALCLCSRTLLDTILAMVQSNQLAQAAGVTRQKVIDG